MEANQTPRNQFLEWILETTQDCHRPEKIRSICDRYMGGSQKNNASNLRDQIKRAVARKKRLLQLPPLQIVQLCFLLSLPVPEHRKEDLKAAGTLSLDRFDRIERFSANDGSYKKEGIHSFHGLSRKSKIKEDVMIKVEELGEGSSRKVYKRSPTISTKTLSKQILNYSAVIETVCLPMFKMRNQKTARGPDKKITLENFSVKFQEAHGALSNAATFHPMGTGRFVPFIECLKLLKFLLLNLDVPEEHPATKRVSENIRAHTNGLGAKFVPITSVDFILTMLHNLIN